MDHLLRYCIEFGLICVLTYESLQYPDRIWDFYNNTGASGLAFNLEESEGVHESFALSRRSCASAFGTFIRRIAELAGPKRWTEVRELDQFTRCIEAPPRSGLRKTDNMPGAIVSIDVDGHISTFSPELVGIRDARYNNFRWGNVHNDCWNSLRENQYLRRAATDVARGIEACRRSCDYFAVCGGGAPSNKLFELRTLDGTETAHCRAKIKALTDNLLPLKEAELHSGLGETTIQL